MFFKMINFCNRDERKFYLYHLFAVCSINDLFRSVEKVLFVCF